MRSATTSDSTLGIYVQVPFCQTKCTYCNFHTGPAARALYAPYARAVSREIGRHEALHTRAGLPNAAETAARTVDTVYIGGGTPSLLDPDDLKGIVDSIRNHLAWAASEVTLEADPETIDASKAGAWKAAGINRISLGVQSFDDRELTAAGRMHRSSDIETGAEVLRAAGFDNISMDLIAGLPHQTMKSWIVSLGRLIATRPEHVSVYLLEIDEGSRLGKEVLAGGRRYSAEQIPDDEAMASFYEEACERLERAGYEHYEISNWALPGRSSRHNQKYWRREPYLGFGAGAHSFDGRWRWANAHDPAAYVAAIEQGRLPTEQQ